jgi:hypothetical protein
MYDLPYYSNCLFRSTTGTWKEKPTADSDIINLSTDSYKIFQDLCAMMAMSEISSMEKDYERISKRVGWPTDSNDMFKGALGAYRRANPSERLTSTTILHNFSV